MIGAGWGLGGEGGDCVLSLLQQMEARILVRGFVMPRPALWLPHKPCQPLGMSSVRYVQGPCTGIPGWYPYGTAIQNRSTPAVAHWCTREWC